MNTHVRLTPLALAVMLAACGGGDDAPQPLPEETRAHDSRIFTPVPASNTTAYPDYVADGARASFAAQAGTASNGAALPATSRWAGELNGAAYRIEVPENWNGHLVMYAHGYRGLGANLTVSNPTIRRYLIENGYAWAASSYSRNYYDVRAGIEDTNALALAFNTIAAERGRSLPAPTRIYITGHSMGGHVAAAAVEAETYATARHKVRYAGSVPMCGVTGDSELFDLFSAMQVTAQAMAGLPAYPTARWADIQTQVTGTLFSSFPAAPITPTATGQRWLSVVENLTGGDRPLFDLAVAGGGSLPLSYGTFGGDGTINGILNRAGTDTNGFTYTITGDAAGSAALNGSVLKVTAAADANRLRTDGLRWIPKVNGEFSVPVVTIHTLGDLFVPFSMEQIYKRRAQARGSDAWLVQRAIRGIAHCDFTLAEQEEAFRDMVNWADHGSPSNPALQRPAGDDVLTPAVVAAPGYGCTFTRAAGAADSTAVAGARTLIANTQPACP